MGFFIHSLQGISSEPVKHFCTILHNTICIEIAYKLIGRTFSINPKYTGGMTMAQIPSEIALFFWICRMAVNNK